MSGEALHPPPPLVATRLAYAGLTPFVIGMALAWLLPPGPDEHTFAMVGLSAYAGVVLAFLGAVYWGHAMASRETQPFPYVWAVAPAALGATVQLMPPYAGLILQGLALLACYAVDRQHYPRWGAQGWLTLRFRCTVIASLCCFLAAAAN